MLVILWEKTRGMHCAAACFGDNWAPSANWSANSKSSTAEPNRLFSRGGAGLLAAYFPVNAA